MHAQHHLPLHVHSQKPVPVQAQQYLATGKLSTITDSVDQRRNKGILIVDRLRKCQSPPTGMQQNPI